VGSPLYFALPCTTCLEFAEFFRRERNHFARIHRAIAIHVLLEAVITRRPVFLMTGQGDHVGMRRALGWLCCARHRTYFGASTFSRRTEPPTIAANVLTMSSSSRA